MKKVVPAALLAAVLPFLSCSSPAGGDSAVYVNLPDSYVRGSEYTILIDESPSDIAVTKNQDGKKITFTAEECDSYSWMLDGTPLGDKKELVIDTASYLSGTYVLSLEAKKGEKLYSYYAQIKVVN